MVVKRPSKKLQRAFIGKLKSARDTVKFLMDEARELYGEDVEGFSLEVEDELYDALQPLERAVSEAEVLVDAK